MKMLLVLAFSLISLSPYSGIASAKENSVTSETYGVNSDYALPLLSIKRIQNTQQVDSGILKDLGIALYKELNLSPEYVLLPKKRVAPSLISGYVNIVCHLHESWQSRIVSDVYWSHDVYRSSNVVAFIGNKPIHKLQDLAGQRVGGVLNFVYVDAEPYFANKTILRENGPNNESNIQKLLNARINYVIMSNLEYDYYKKIYPNLDRADFEMDALNTKCALSQKSKIKIEDLNKAIATLKKNGTLERILKSYQ
jgi:polar amino acid transport system substrate-binding protein